MLRVLNTLPKLQITTEAFSNLENIRWQRKPRWVPIAKSKMFRVPARPQVPEIEAEEMKRLFNNYRTEVKSIRRYLSLKFQFASQQTVDPEVLKKAFEEDFAKCNDINDEWNKTLKVVRETRYIEDLTKDLTIAKGRLIERHRIREEKFQDAENLVKEQKAISHTFITRENIDDAIEKAISTVVDHNFAIDINGNKIVGRETEPEIVEKGQKSNEKLSIKQ